MLYRPAIYCYMHARMPPFKMQRVTTAEYSNKYSSSEAVAYSSAVGRLWHCLVANGAKYIRTSAHNSPAHQRDGAAVYTYGARIHSGRRTLHWAVPESSLCSVSRWVTKYTHMMFAPQLLAQPTQWYIGLTAGYVVVHHRPRKRTQVWEITAGKVDPWLLV